MATAKPPKTPFTIINRNREVNVKRAEFESNLTHGLKRNAPKTAELFAKLPKPLREATLSAAVPDTPLQKWVRSPRSSKPEQSALVTRFGEAVRLVGQHAVATSIGVLDMGARVARLPRLIAHLNKVQDRMVFIEVQTPVPAGMLKTGQMLVAEFEQALKNPLSDEQKRQLRQNMLVNEFLIFAESVRQKNELDSLCGITPAMLAFHDDSQHFWNYFSFGNGGPLSVVSTFDLRAYAANANRPFEAAVGMLIVGQVVSTRNHLSFHEATRGCPLDFNAKREGLVESIKTMRFDAECMKAIETNDPNEAKAAREMMNALRRMKLETR